MKKSILLLTLTAILMTGCGSIINGSTQNMSIQAQPASANIQLLSSNGATIYESTGTLFYDLKRKKGFFQGANYNLKISALGYEPQIIPITSSVNGWYLAGNLLFGGVSLIGWLIVDPATGGMWALEAHNGQDIESLKVILKKDATLDQLSSAKKVQ